MTDKEKVKAYDEALKKASAAHKDEDRHLKATLERIFPELKEDDDKRIKKELIQWVDEFPDTIWRGHYKKDIIDWIEKQGEQKKQVHFPKFTFDDILVLQCCMVIVKNVQEDNELYEQLNLIHNKMYDAYRLGKLGETSSILSNSSNNGKNEQTPDDKIDPRFKVGDWLCANELNDYANLIKIVKIVDVFGKKRYKISRDYDSDLDLTEFDFIEKHYHLWTIQDAKDGDVLEFEDHGRFVIGILSFVNKTTGKVDVSCLLECNKFKVGVFYNLDTVKPHPATKEQRDSLMKAMNDAGYEWDAEKKELNTKKINLKK